MTDTREASGGKMVESFPKKSLAQVLQIFRSGYHFQDAFRHRTVDITSWHSEGPRSQVPGQTRHIFNFSDPFFPREMNLIF